MIERCTGVVAAMGRNRKSVHIIILTDWICLRACVTQAYVIDANHLQPVEESSFMQLMLMSISITIPPNASEHNVSHIFVSPHKCFSVCSVLIVLLRDATWPERDVRLLKADTQYTWQLYISALPATTSS